MQVAVNVVWYVINLASSRVQDFERDICVRLFSDLPIAFILNKSDCATPEAIETMRAAVETIPVKQVPEIIHILLIYVHFSTHF
jgi:hypothetical protein